MFSFSACFWNSDVYINGKYKYAANEILTAYLNTEYLPAAKELRIELLRLKNALLLVEDMSYTAYGKYDINVQTAMRKIEEINSWLQDLPPYNSILTDPIITLEDVINRHSHLFEDGLDLDNDDDISWDTTTNFGCGEVDEFGNGMMRLHKFQPVDMGIMDCRDAVFANDLNEFNQDISQFFDSYISFVDSYILIQKVSRPFVEQYLHRTGTFPTEYEAAKCYDDFNKQNDNAFKKIKCRTESFGYKVLTNEAGKPILCEEISFADIHSFVFYDLFNGIRKNYIPNQCKYCGSFFLIRAGKYYGYCNTPLKDDPRKNCRDVGARRSYDDKCKNDPIWQTYNRAYKAHYARYMKKKMTVAEFEQWSRFASELRDKTIDGLIDYEQYYVDIRK